MKNQNEKSDELGHNCASMEEVKDMAKGFEMDKRDEIRMFAENGYDIAEEDLKYLNDDWEEEWEEEWEETHEDYSENDE